MRVQVIVALCASGLTSSLPAQSLASACVAPDASCLPPNPAREFRGVWVASVANIDWPSKPGLTRAASQRELRTLLDRSKSSGLNAVILQVRPAGDALYASTLEPWSEFLTGKQGVAPSPRWDPLTFAVTEAHARGLELHVWFNPYRAKHPSGKGPLSRLHLARTHPSLVKSYGTHLWMDPGEPAVRAHTVRVVLDVVRRYDVDGVHIDDYFYPYKERDPRGAVLDFPDSGSYERYLAGGGTLGRDDWRRDNVDRLVQELHVGIHATKPWVKFGISPFGIWRPGYPEQIKGFDAYAELFADARRWIREGWVDYFTPQLYWPVAQEAQSFPVLLHWWAEQNAFGRHLWPGNYASKVGEAGRTAWRTPEIEEQIAVTRREPAATGNIHFSAKVFLEDRDALATTLGRHAYGEIALVPPTPWLDVAPLADARLDVRRAASNGRAAQFTLPGGAKPQWWFVQTRHRDGTWRGVRLAGTTTRLTLAPAVDRVAVRSIDRAGVEGAVVVVKVRR